MSSAITKSVTDAHPAASPAVPASYSPQVSPPVVGADWSPFGALIPVLAGSAGAGASVFAAATVDALQRAGRCTLLIDAAEPFRSGLCSATEVEGQHTTSPAPGLRVRYSWRDHVVVARKETDLDPATTSIPELEPLQWLPLPPLEPLHTTVVDLGQDWIRPEACAPTGACGWLHGPAAFSPAPRPVLVVRATRPSLMAAEAALARLDSRITSGQVLPPARLVVMASWKKRGWPAGVAGAAGARVARLLDDAVFVPYDRDLDIGGITAAPAPTRVQSAVADLLKQWGLLTSSAT